MHAVRNTRRCQLPHKTDVSRGRKSATLELRQLTVWWVQGYARRIWGGLGVEYYRPGTMERPLDAPGGHRDEIPEASQSCFQQVQLHYITQITLFGNLLYECVMM